MPTKPDRRLPRSCLISIVMLLLTAGFTLGPAGARMRSQQDQRPTVSIPKEADAAPVMTAPPIRSLVPEVSIDPPRFESVEGTNMETGERVVMRFMKVTVHNQTPVAIRMIRFGWGSMGQQVGEPSSDSPEVVPPFGEYELVFSAEEFDAGDVLELRAVVFVNGTTSGSRATIRSASPENVDERRTRPLLDRRCSGGGAFANGCCRSPSAILIDLAGDGLSMTDDEGGVLFDMSGDGTVDRTAWTAAGSDDAWLFLDRNDNSIVDDATELFGAMTPQPATRDTTGFLALRALDSNGDGQLSRLDRAFVKLRLWTDTNHDGVSQRDELSSLAGKGVTEIHLDFEERQVFDASENCHRLRGSVRVEPNGQLKVLAWEVIPTMDYGWN